MVFFEIIAVHQLEVRNLKYASVCSCHFWLVSLLYFMGIFRCGHSFSSFATVDINENPFVHTFTYAFAHIGDMVGAKSFPTAWQTRQLNGAPKFDYNHCLSKCNSKLAQCSTRNANERERKTMEWDDCECVCVYGFNMLCHLLQLI